MVYIESPYIQMNAIDWLMLEYFLDEKQNPVTKNFAVSLIHVHAGYFQWEWFLHVYLHGDK